MTTQRFVRSCLALAFTSALGASAAEMSWNYGDIRYQQPDDENIRGGVGEISGHVTDHLLMQGRVNHLAYEEGDLKISQTRYDLAVGWLFDLHDDFHAVVSGGYTHLDYTSQVQGFTGDASDHAGNVQVAVRGAFARWFEADAAVEMLFDDKSTSVLLWSTGVRYRFKPNVSVHLGMNGSEDSETLSDVVYTLGFRFDLSD